MQGYIKLHRVFRDWEWYTEPNMVLFLIHCLLKANHKKGTWKGVEINKGQFVSGRKTLSVETGLSERQVRTCISKLEKSGELTSQTTNRKTLFTLKKWKKFQNEEVSDQPDVQPATSQRPANDQLTTTNKNDKNKENDKNNILCDEFLKHWNSISGIAKRSFKTSDTKSKAYDKIKARLKSFKHEDVEKFFISLSESNHIFSEKWFTLDFCIKSDENFEKVINKWMEWKKAKKEEDRPFYACLFDEEFKL